MIAPAAACRPFLEALETRTAAELIELVQATVGGCYEVTGDTSLIEAAEDERRGGRRDDAARAGDLEAALGEDAVAAIVMVRGGAWLTRALPRIDFGVLDRRERPVAVFAFSEGTSLVNLVGSHRLGRGVYDMGPAFLTYGLQRYASQRARWDAPAEEKPDGWMRERLRPEVAGFFRDVVRMIEGQPSERAVSVQFVHGELRDTGSEPADDRDTQGGGPAMRVVGGNLTVMSALVGTRYDRCVRPAGCWLLLEDFNDKLDRMDRFLANLTLAGFWDECAGLLLGDFHRGYEDLRPAVLEVLPFHLPPGRRLPVLTTDCIGHVWPMSPLPLHQALYLARAADGTLSLRWDESATRTVETVPG